MQIFKVTKKECTTKDLCMLWLTPADSGSVFEFSAGQFVMVNELDEAGESVYKRAYSIASAPFESKEMIALGVKAQGKMSQMLYDAKVGDEFGIDGPYGQFKMPQDEKVVFFAGGVGVTPFRSMICEALQNGSKQNMTLFYSGRTFDDLLYHDEFALLAEKHANFIYVPTLTREEPENWKGEIGRLSDELVSKYVQDFDAGFIMCGPVEMMDGVKSILESKGVDVKTRLKAERY